jgi:enolase-phosphatase E1
VIRTADVRAVVLDIEGTISSLEFVKQELFPFARRHLVGYIRAHEAEIVGILDQVRAAEGDPALDTHQIIAVLLRWMDEDRKSPPLKALQGMIWRQGFESGELRGHFYDDAVRAIRQWHQRGLQIHIYSSGSMEAQKLLFSHSAYGDLTLLLAGHFDTTTGSKLDSRSYRAIAIAIGQVPKTILFLSDHPGEIEAASTAGLQAILVNREARSKDDSGAGTISTFDELAVAGAVGS